MSYYGFPDFTKLFVALIVTVCVLLPFAIWKLVEILIILFSHIKFI